MGVFVQGRIVWEEDRPSKVWDQLRQPRPDSDPRPTSITWAAWICAQKIAAKIQAAS